MKSTRRGVLKGLALSSVAVAAGSVAAAPTLKGNIKQGTCPGALGRKLPIEKKCEMAVKLGLVGFDFVGSKDWPTLKKHGLVCTMASSGTKLTKGLNHVENHAGCLDKIRKAIEVTSAAGFKNVICFSGNRDGIGEEEGRKNCVTALKQVAALAERKNVIICMELLNSKLNHPDYQCDRTHWGAEMCREVGSPNVKLLYDIYHMQVQEGDIIATIRKYYEYIAHFHTAGVPGRHDLGESQELYYPAIMKAIKDLGYKGYVSHEYTPKLDTAEVAMAKAVAICDV